MSGEMREVIGKDDSIFEYRFQSCALCGMRWLWKTTFVQKNMSICLINLSFAKYKIIEKSNVCEIYYVPIWKISIYLFYKIIPMCVTLPIELAKYHFI